MSDVRGRRSDDASVEHPHVPSSGATRQAEGDLQWNSKRRGIPRGKPVSIEQGGRLTGISRQTTQDGRRIKEKSKEKAIVPVILMTGLVIFGYSVILEGVQFFLSYRTFNPYDILGNGLGVGAFCWILLVRAKGC